MLFRMIRRRKALVLESCSGKNRGNIHEPDTKIVHTENLPQSAQIGKESGGLSFELYGVLEMPDAGPDRPGIGGEPAYSAPFYTRAGICRF